MTQSPPSFIPPKVALVLGGLAVAVSAAVPFFPDVAKAYASLGAFVLAALAGIALPQLSVVAGKGAVTGSVATALGSGAVIVEGLSRSLPETWQPLAYAGAALLALLTGKALPSFAPAQKAGLNAPPGSGVDA